MKSIFTLIAVIYAFSPSFAQDKDAEIDAVVTLLGIQKRQAVDQLVNITKKDSASFWKTYAAFEAEQSKYRKKRLQTYDKLVQSYDNLDDLAADQLAKDFIELRVGQEKLLEQYYGKMKAVTHSALALQFYQAETYLLVLARAQIMQQIPTYGQVMKNRKNP